MNPPTTSKTTLSPSERKLDTQLRLAVQAAPSSDDPVTIEIACRVDPLLLAAIESLHGTIVEQSPRWGVIVATVPLSHVLAIASRDEVRRVKLPSKARVNRP